MKYESKKYILLDIGIINYTIDLKYKIDMQNNFKLKQQ